MCWSRVEKIALSARATLLDAARAVAHAYLIVYRDQDQRTLDEIRPLDADPPEVGRRVDPGRPSRSHPTRAE